jgi:hypothetical protein
MAVLIIAIFWLGLYPRPILNTTGPLLSTRLNRALSSRDNALPSGAMSELQQPVGKQGGTQ